MKTSSGKENRSLIYLSTPFPRGLPGVGLVVVGGLLKPLSSVATTEDPLTLKAPRFPLSAAAFNIAITCSSLTCSLNVRTKETITLPGLEFEQKTYLVFYLMR